MKKSWILVCFLAFVATAGTAQPPGLAAIFAPAEGCASPGSSLPAGPQDEKVLAASMEKALCQASCGSGTYVSCSYEPPSTCVAVDRNCTSNQRGYVTCNGVTTYCPTTCATPCTEGTLRYLWSGYCCDEGGKERHQQQCVNGQWVYTGVVACGGPCGPIIP